MKGSRPDIRGLKKVRKPRGFKLDGTQSLDMCSGCIAFGCDPMAMSRAFRDKKDKRRSLGVCVSCGNTPCRCKSSLGSKPQTISHRDALIAIDKENKKESDIRSKYFRGGKRNETI